jgi:hypothetical protein
MKNDLRIKIKHVELEYPVETIEYSGIKIWPFIRSELFKSYFSSGDFQVSTNDSQTSVFSKIKRIFLTLRTTSLSTLFKKKSAVLFTDDGSGLRYLNGKLTDIFAISVLTHEKDLIPIVRKERTPSITAFLHYINNEFFSILTNFYLLIKRNITKKIINKQILTKIISDLQIEFDLDKYLSRVLSFLAVFRLYFNIIKPKKVFLVCYCGIEKMAASYIAKTMNIPVIELQHGVISNEHYSYITKINITPNPYPNYLLCFGEGFKKFVSHFICKQENIFVTGNHYIDFLRKTKDRNLFSKKYSNNNSQLLVTVAGQSEFDNLILEFIGEILKFRQDIYFIYVPRDLIPELIRFSHANISIETELSIYQCMQNSHITSTVYSSCAVESLALGTPVILINIQKAAKVFYSDFFLPSDAVFYADTPEEYVSHITAALNRNREQIALDALYYYADNSRERTAKALETINKKR